MKRPEGFDEHAGLDAQQEQPDAADRSRTAPRPSRARGFRAALDGVREARRGSRAPGAVGDAPDGSARSDRVASSASGLPELPDVTGVPDGTELPGEGGSHDDGAVAELEGLFASPRATPPATSRPSSSSVTGDADATNVLDPGRTGSGRPGRGRTEPRRRESGRIQSGRIQSGRSESGRSESGRSESGRSESGTSDLRDGAPGDRAPARSGAASSNPAPGERGTSAPEAGRASRPDRAVGDDQGASVDDPHTATAPHADVASHVPHATPIGARVRAAETAREARIARKRRRLLERAEVRRFTRRSRHRRAAWIAAGGVVAVLVASILVAVYSPLMALRTIEVKGTDRVDAAEVRAALSGQIGTPLARIDLDEVKDRIGGFPLIESYVTEEEPPHTLVVTVTERTPVVAVRSGKSYDLVDPAGIVVQSTTKKPGDVPIADVGRTTLGSSVFRTMTEVVLAMPSSVRDQVAGIAASTSDDVTLSMRDGSTVVWGSPDESAAKARLLAALVADHAKRAPDAKVEFDVSAPDNGIIRPRS